MYDEIKREEKNNKIVYILFLIIIVLISLLLYFIFFNKDKKEPGKCDVPVVEQPQYQLINYSNYIFKMPLEWKFVDDNTGSGITNDNNNIFISFETLDDSYDLFISNEYQMSFIEDIQTTNNIKIDQFKEYENCYLYEGTFNNYDYLIVAMGNDKKTILIKTQFQDKTALNNFKNKVINFSLSGVVK